MIHIEVANSMSQSPLSNSSKPNSRTSALALPLALDPNLSPNFHCLKGRQQGGIDIKLRPPALMFNAVIQIIMVAAFITCSSLAVAKASKPPNILLIVVDDMGHSDLGAFGSEIATPNLDALAFEGIRFSNFLTAPTCSPTRAMLLSGVDNHRAGLGNMHEELAPNQKGRPGYEGYINNRVVTLAERLKQQKYHTYMAGKWHLGLSEDASPSARGFEKSFAMLSGGASHFNDMKPAYAPTIEAKAPYRQDGKLLKKLPKEFVYSSNFYANRIVSDIKSNQADGKPFFAYLSFTAPHWPIQAPDHTIEKYQGRYDAGYDVLAGTRLKQQKALGLVPAAAKKVSYSSKTKPWQVLTAAEKKIQSRNMETYAAMIDEVDRSTGSVIEYLKSQKLLKNTIVVFLSDNGAEGHDLDSTWPAEQFPKIRQVINQSHDFRFKNIGRMNSYSFVGEGWSQASSPGLKHYKGAITEGGIRTAAFVYYPAVLKSGHIEHSIVSVKDITPTLLDMIGVDDKNLDPKVEAITGLSVLPRLVQGDGGAVSSGAPLTNKEPRILAWELMGKRAVRQGHWKLVHMPKPYGNADWQLYDLKTDLGEQNNLANQNPEKLEQMKALWYRYAKKNKVILPNWVSGY